MDRDFLIKAVFGCALATQCTAVGAAETISLIERHAFLPAYRQLDVSPVHFDFDGDGKQDIAYIGMSGSNRMVDIVGYSQSGFVRKQAFLILDHVNPSIYLPLRILPWRDSEGSHLAVTVGNSLTHYSGWPLRKIRTITTPGSDRAMDIAIDDIDNDGTPEFVTAATGTSQLTIHSLVNGAVMWQQQVPHLRDPTGLLLAQLDADPALEIVISSGSGTGAVIDGATRAIEWTAQGLRDDLHFGRFVGDRASFLGTGNRWALIGTDPWGHIWDSFSVNSGVVATGDVDGDGIDEAVYTSSGPALKVMEVASRDIRALVEPEVISFLGVVDLDANGTSEIITSSNENPQVLKVRDGVSGSTVSTLEREMAGGYMVSPFLHSEGDPSTDFFVAAGGWSSYLRRVNALTGETVWDIPIDDALLSSDIVDIDVVEHGVAQRPEVLLTISDGFGNGLLVFFDAEHGKLLRTLNVFTWEFGALWDSAVVTEPAGNARSILSCTSDGRVREFRFPDGVLLWTSPQTGYGCKSVWATHGTNGHELVYSDRTGLRAFDADTKVPTWRIDTADGPTWHIVSEDERDLFLVNRGDGVISVYDASTQKELRTFAISPEWGGTRVVRIAALPGAGTRFLAVRSINKISVIDGFTGETYAMVDTIGYFNEIRGGLATSRIAHDEYLVATAGGGTWIFDLTIPANEIFSHGFENSKPSSSSIPAPSQPPRRSVQLEIPHTAQLVRCPHPELRAGVGSRSVRREHPRRV